VTVFRLEIFARIDLDRLELQRLQYESDLQAALVSLRTTKINLLALLDDRRPVDTFDVDGSFDFGEALLSLDDYRKMRSTYALTCARPALSVNKLRRIINSPRPMDQSTPPSASGFTHNGSFTQS